MTRPLLEVPLQIARASQSRRDTVAWFVSGSDPQVWLADIVAWPVSMSSIVLRPIPRGCGDRTPAGVLVSAEPGGVAHRRADVRCLHVETLALPYGCVAGRLYLPIDAEFRPAVSDAELAALLPADDGELVWHPAFGLVRCEPHERLRVTDLVLPPPRTPSRWGRAVPGLSFRSRLLSVEAAVTLSAEEILRAAGEDIGSTSNSIDDLPPSPGEGLGGQIYEWTKPLRRAWKSLFKPKPKSASTSAGSPGVGSSGGPGWLDWVEWAAAPVAVVAGMLGNLLPRSLVNQEARLREVDRLLNLLKNDPDAGLRFALPIGGGAAGRGIAPPSNQLLPRDLNFGLGRLGGGPVDPWLIPPSQQFQLIQLYGELAAREIRMGRHRRAAYIFAELLGDLQAAAGALEAGLHFRDAAVLYRDRLKRPADAARCLDRGGLLDEAAELYIELGMFENAADLYVRLQRPDEAERLLRNWVTQLVHQGEHLRASGVIHQKLHDLDGALEVLESGWSSRSIGAESCLRHYFRLLGDNARHATALQRVRQLRDQPGTALSASEVARILSGVATGYVDQTVRHDAADATRVIVSRQLATASAVDRMALLATIRSLAPQDRLLLRDCDRFHTQKSAALVKRNKPPRRRSQGVLLVREFEFAGSKIQWTAAKSSSRSLTVVGYSSGGLVLHEALWANSGPRQHRSEFWPRISPDHRILLEVPRPSGKQVLVHAVGCDPLPLQTLSNFTHPSGVETAGSPTWASSATVAFACAEGGALAWHVRAVFGTLEVAAFAPTGEQIQSALLPLAFTEDQAATVPVFICAAASPVRVGIGRLICRKFGLATDAGTDEAALRYTDEFVELEADICSLHNHRDSLTDCVVALFDAGGVMIREPIQEHSPQPIAEGIESPTGVFLHDGTFVVAGRRECRAYRFAMKSIQQVGQISLDVPAVAVTGTDLQGQFAILGEDGKVQVYGIQQ